MRDQAPGQMHEWRVVVEMVTGVTAEDQNAAEEAILGAIPNPLELGPAGAVFPFDLLAVTAEPIAAERLSRAIGAIRVVGRSAISTMAVPPTTNMAKATAKALERMRRRG